MSRHQSVARLLIPGVCFCLVWPALQAATPNRQSDTVKTSRGDLRLTPLYHGSVMLEFGGKVIHVDPWSQTDYAGLPQADLIVVTHTHADHLDRAAIDKLKKPETLIVSTAAGIDTLNCAPACGQVETINDSEQKSVLGVAAPRSADHGRKETTRAASTKGMG